MKRPWAFALVVAAASCREDPAVRAQWTITLRTDAPVSVVGDRVLVEILDAQGRLACDSCRRLFDAGSEAAWPLSLGIVAAPAPPYVRARLYRSRATRADGTPDPQAALDVVAALPAVAGPVVIPLVMACFGVAAVVAPWSDRASCDAATGALGPVAPAASGEGDAALRPGSWSESRSAPCASPAPEGMVCLEGGPFFFGDADPAATREQLVRVSSFFADRDELSVGTVRALVARGAVPAPLRQVPGMSDRSQCTYLGETDATNDDEAVNCVSFELAEALCVAQGKRLLTEAELAYAAGNGGRGTRYPWGDDEAICEHAVVGRDGLPDELTDPLTGETSCRSAVGRPSFRLGPVPLSVASRDETLAPAVLRNLGGNLAEWVQDTYAPLDDACWRGRPLLVDPVCRSGVQQTLRGGGWSTPLWWSSARFRTSTGNQATSYVGLRCAESAVPR